MQALVLLTPWDSLPDLAQSIYWFMPARWLVRDQYDSVKHLRSFDGRVAVVVAEKDRVIPVQHGLRLYESVQSEKQLWTFSNVGHNNWPNHPTAPWWEEVMHFCTSDPAPSTR